MWYYVGSRGWEKSHLKWLLSLMLPGLFQPNWLEKEPLSAEHIHLSENFLLCSYSLRKQKEISICPSCLQCRLKLPLLWSLQNVTQGSFWASFASGSDAVLSKYLETPVRLHPKGTGPSLRSQNQLTKMAVGHEPLKPPEVRSHSSSSLSHLSLPHPPLPTSFIATKCSLWNVWRWGFRSGQPFKNMNCYHELWVAFQLCWQKFTPCRPPPKKKKLSR